MPNHRLRTIISWALLFAFPASLIAQTSQATLQAKGAVSVNGKQVPGNTAVFVGDRIQTAAGGSASLAAQGLMVVVPENTSLVYGDRVLDLGCGGVMVSTTIGEVVRVAGTTVTPLATGATRFEVSQMGGSLKIEAREGSIKVEDGGTPRDLNPGQNVTRPAPQSGACGPVATTVPQAKATTILPGILVAAASALIAYCAVNGFCSQSSPSAP